MSVNTSFCCLSSDTKRKAVPVHDINTHRESVVMAPLILNLGANLGEWSASRPGHFTLEKELSVPNELESG
jgi:hypothetical protein